MRCGSVAVQGDPEELGGGGVEGCSPRRRGKKGRNPHPNPYSSLGMDRFERLQAHLSKRRAQIAAQRGIPEHAVKFVSSAHGHGHAWTPVIARSSSLLLDSSSSTPTPTPTPSTPSCSDTPPNEQDQDEDGDVDHEIGAAAARRSCASRFLRLVLSFVLLGRTTMASCVLLFKNCRLVMALFRLLVTLCKGFAFAFAFATRNMHCFLSGSSRPSTNTGSVICENPTGTRQTEVQLQRCASDLGKENSHAHAHSRPSSSFTSPEHHQHQHHWPMLRVGHSGVRRHDQFLQAAVVAIVLFLVVFFGKIPAVVGAAAWWYAVAAYNNRHSNLDNNSLMTNKNNNRRPHSRSRAFDLQSPEYRKKILEALANPSTEHDRH